MIALIRLDTQAIKTARLSASRLKLRPRQNCFEIKMVCPDKTSGISLKDMTKEDKINRKERIFRKRLDILAAKGRRNAPITGMKIALKINPSLFILYPLFTILEFSGRLKKPCSKNG